MAKRISLLESIHINASCEKIFDYISDVGNDPHWRPEVARMEVKGERKIGTVIIEYITIYRFFHVITPTEIRVLERPGKFVVETPSTHPTWVQCIRSVKDVGNGSSEFSVQLSFTLDNLKQITPIVPHSLFVRMWYRPRMKKYMRKLKKILENDPS